VAAKVCGNRVSTILQDLFVLIVALAFQKFCVGQMASRGFGSLGLEKFREMSPKATVARVAMSILVVAAIHDTEILSWQKYLLFAPAQPCQLWGLALGKSLKK